MMEFDRVRKFIMPPGQIIGLALIGILLLSALVYYKSVKAQRYLEPTLAIAQPRIEFAHNMINLLKNGLGAEQIKGVSFAANSIFVHHSVMFSEPVKGGLDRKFLKNLSQIMLSVLSDPGMRPQIDLILISTNLPLSPDPEINKRERIEMQQISELILDSLYILEPELNEKYRSYFAASVVPVQSRRYIDRIEFRFIPSEHVHIEMIKSLEKYYF